MIDWSSLENKWRKRWEEEKIFEANYNEEKKKFFITVAYPYPNSPQHIGHGRTYTLTDVHARYMRMQGYNVLFPMGFHYTGTPILAMARRIEQGDKELIDTFLKIYQVPKEKISSFKDSINIARYFHAELKEGMKEMGYSIDWRREFTTIDKAYNKFIEWQFKKLYEKGFIAKGTHPVGWCPRDQNPVGQHDTLGDVEPEIGEYVLIKFELDGFYLPTATLRPETIFGVTNLWVNPKANYVEAKVDQDLWIVSNEAAEKLRYQNRKVEVLKEIRGESLIGKKVKNPINFKEVIILPASFVNPKNGTGVVMSVPAHAPYDYQALKELKNETSSLKLYHLEEEVRKLEPIVIIESPRYKNVPAQEAIEQKGINSQLDKRLEEITSELYTQEFYQGIMKENTMEYSGLRVSEAREKIREDLMRIKKLDTMYEIMNSPVICRCGAECIVKTFEDQWFIDYGNKDWKNLARECLNSMDILPNEIREEFNHTIDWLSFRACARKSGLGTNLPWDKDWIIESLSDSVIYMAYYILSLYLNNGSVKAENLTHEFFDYIFLGKDEDKAIEATGIDREILRKIRRDFLYFYPLDSRHSGRDLVPNHLTFFIFNHVALFDKEFWPKQIVVNGSVLMEGKKMSKSLGNIVPLRKAIREYGVDPLRLAILANAELLQDAYFSVNSVYTFQEKLNKLYNFAREVLSLPQEEGSISYEDRWILSILQRSIDKVTKAMERLRIREAIHEILYLLDQNLSWYLRRVQVNEERKKGLGRVLREILDVRIRLLAPIAPIICEEIWELMGGKGFVSLAEWPKVDSSKIEPKIELSEEILMSLMDDIKQIIKVRKVKPKALYLYIRAHWKWKAYLRGLKFGGKFDFKNLVQHIIKEEGLKEKGKEVVELVKSLMDHFASEDARARWREAEEIDEYDVILKAKDFLKKELNCNVEIYREEDKERYDPLNRAPRALPFKPAIYME
ncbi:MAG: leucine--tRNA ligase [Nitrososphaerales archaeon]